MRQTQKYAIAVAVCAIFALGAWLGTAMADRSATAPPIVYSGQVLNAAGLPIADSTTNTVTLSLYDGDDSGVDTRLCPVVNSTTVATRAGHFSLPLSTACSNVFERAEEVWVHLVVNGTTIAATRAGAVPHAVTAERTVLRGPAGGTTTGGSYCGITPAVHGAVTSGALVGYEAVHALCRTACASSSTAHICSLVEWENNMAIGGPRPAAGTLAANAGRIGAAVSYAETPGGRRLNDCLGWNSNSDIYVSAAWIFDPGVGQGYPGVSSCDAVTSFLCCD